MGHRRPRLVRVWTRAQLWIIGQATGIPPKRDAHLAPGRPGLTPTVAVKGTFSGALCNAAAQEFESSHRDLALATAAGQQ